jgi:hypothetical protein
VLVTPEDMLTRALKGNHHLQQFRIVLPSISSGVLDSEEGLHLRPSCLRNELYLPLCMFVPIEALESIDVSGENG